MPTRAMLAAAAAAFGASAWAALDGERGGLAILLAAVAVLVAGMTWVERAPGATRDVALVGTVAGIAAAGRVLFAPVPGVQPVTVIVLAAGVALGPRRGFAVGALAALVSNFFLGQGVWTPWQMLAWGACGVAGGLGGRLLRGRLALAGAGFLAGLLFGSFMTVWEWYAFYPHTGPALLTLLARGVPFDLAHALGNVLLALAAGPELRRVLERYERRTRVEIAWDVT